DTSGGAGPPDTRKKGRGGVLPGNIALVSPPVDHLDPLQRYNPFLLEDGGPAGGLVGDEVAAAQELSPCSAFPAGLVPRFRAELRPAGYRVVVDDRRAFGDEFRLNKWLIEVSWGEEMSLVRAVRGHPQGQVWCGGRDARIWRIGHICNLWPRARVLIVAS